MRMMLMGLILFISTMARAQGSCVDIFANTKELENLYENPAWVAGNSVTRAIQLNGARETSEITPLTLQDVISYTSTLDMYQAAAFIRDLSASPRINEIPTETKFGGTKADYIQLLVSAAKNFGDGILNNVFTERAAGNIQTFELNSRDLTQIFKSYGDKEISMMALISMIRATSFEAVASVDPGLLMAKADFISWSSVYRTSQTYQEAWWLITALPLSYKYSDLQGHESAFPKSPFDEILAAKRAASFRLGPEAEILALSLFKSDVERFGHVPWETTVLRFNLMVEVALIAKSAQLSPKHLLAYDSILDFIKYSRALKRSNSKWELELTALHLMVVRLSDLPAEHIDFYFTYFISALDMKPRSSANIEFEEVVPLARMQTDHQRPVGFAEILYYLDLRSGSVVNPKARWWNWNKFLVPMTPEQAVDFILKNETPAAYAQ